MVRMDLQELVVHQDLVEPQDRAEPQVHLDQVVHQVHLDQVVHQELDLMLLLILQIIEY
jgi:hypothetical protein